MTNEHSDLPRRVSRVVEQSSAAGQAGGDAQQAKGRETGLNWTGKTIDVGHVWAPKDAKNRGECGRMLAAS